jgi:hypothetical protein
MMYIDISVIVSYTLTLDTLLVQILNQSQKCISMNDNELNYIIKLCNINCQIVKLNNPSKIPKH